MSNRANERRSQSSAYTHELVHGLVDGWTDVPLTCGHVCVCEGGVRGERSLHNRHNQLP